MHKLRTNMTFITILFIVLIVFTIYDNNRVVVVKRTFTFSKLPEEFDGYRILHISDIHAKEFGKQQRRLLNKIEGERIDMVALTGDYIDSYNPHMPENKTATINLISGLKGMYPDVPIFYVKGNAEDFDQVSLNENMIKAGAIALDEYGKQPYTITRNDSSIMVGLSSYNMKGFQERYKVEKSPAVSLDRFYIALTHYPSDFEVEEKIYKYSGNHQIPINGDLFLAGHTHGGQIRLPFIGAVFTPIRDDSKKPLPSYSENVYSENSRILNVSKGLGTSGPWFLRFRLLNPPEVNIVELRKS